MSGLVSLSLTLVLLSIGMLSIHAQFCNRADNQYIKCDHTTPVCECTSNVCRFCFEIEQRHTFTRYRLDNEIEIPGYGGSVWYFDDNGDLVALPDELGIDDQNAAECVNNPSLCTDAYTTDGNSFRPIITINNRFPAPTLIVPNNSIVLVDVYNRLSSEAASIHWHGMHQMNTPWMDGVEHITQCGIAPSSSFRYIFRANPHGTHWYHSHSGAQRTDGLFGALIVREDSPPQGIEPFVDEPDKYTLTLIDWQRENSLDLFAQIHAGIRYFDQDGEPPTPTRTADTEDPRVPRTCSPDGTEVGPVSYWSGLINGLGRHRNVSYGKTLLSTFTVEPNNSYRFRLIGAQSLYAYMFSIDEHNLTLIATDGHFIQPEIVQFIIIHSGERYDFVIDTMTMPTKDNFIIRAETLEVNMSNPSTCGNINGAWPGELFSLFPDHSAEAILHYGSTSDIPSNSMYQEIADSAVPMREQCAAMSRECVAVNCPFQQFPSKYGIKCMHIHELGLNEAEDDQMPDLDFNTKNTYFFNFGFEGDGSTSAINGRNFVFPPAPLQLNNDKPIPNRCSLTTDKCDSDNRLVTPDCLCTYVRDIEYEESYRFVFTAVGPNNANWNFAHPIHLHGHSFHVAKIGFGNYSDTGRIMSASEDISCNNNTYICTNPQWSSEDIGQGKNNKMAPLKDTVLIPAGGYAVVYFKANNPGYWFLHCHIEVHQLEGMAVVINEAKDKHKPPPANMPMCGNFTWSIEEFEGLVTVPPVVDQAKYYQGLFVIFCVLFALASAALICILAVIVLACIAAIVTEKKTTKKSRCNYNSISVSTSSCDMEHQ